VAADAQECAQLLMESVPPVMRFIRTQMRQHTSLSVPQFRALGFLQRRTGASQSELAGHLGVTPPTASALVDRLVQQGLVDRCPHPRERRRHVLTLTAAGSELLAAAQAASRTRAAAALAALHPDELQTLAAGLRVLARAFREVTTTGHAAASR
jgi:DNA-binding MarR family transcriptional regulator